MDKLVGSSIFGLMLVVVCVAASATTGTVDKSYQQMQNDGNYLSESVPKYTSYIPHLETVSQ